MHKPFLTAQVETEGDFFMCGRKPKKGGKHQSAGKFRHLLTVCLAKVRNRHIGQLQENERSSADSLSGKELYR